MTEFRKAFFNGNGDKVLEILEKRYPLAPSNALAAMTMFLLIKVKTPGELAKLEPRLDELVGNITRTWEDNGW